MFDEAQFQKQVPYPLLATNIPGAFTSPIPPVGFDPNTASTSDMLRHGFLWRRPPSSEQSAARRAWERALSRRWHVHDIIVPHMLPSIRKRRGFKGAANVDPAYYSANWSGAVVTRPAGYWNANIGFWKIPTVRTPPQKPEPDGNYEVSTWVGLDGRSNDPVLQAGITQVVDSHNDPLVCFAWFEWYVSPPAGMSDYPSDWLTQAPYIDMTPIGNFPVSPGDQVSVTVQYLGGTAGQIHFANHTTGKQIMPLTLAPPPTAACYGQDIEWIVEAPGIPASPLAGFSPVTFNPAVGCGPSLFAPGEPADGDTIIITIGNPPVALTSTTVQTDTVTVDFIG